MIDINDPVVAARLLAAVDRRVDQILAQRQVRVAYGVVDAVSPSTMRCSVFLYGQATSTPGFVYAVGERPETGDRVRVVMLPGGDRYVDALLTGYGRLRFVPMTRQTIFSSATTSTTIARTLTGAISGVPASARLVSGYATLWSTVLNVSNLLLLFHTEAGSNDIGEILQAGSPGIHNRLATGFQVGVVQSGGAKISYSVNRADGTLTYDLFVTGYWTDDE